MNEELKDILSEGEKLTDPQRLMDYLRNHLSEADSHALEKHMAEDAFLNDAMEGLQQFGSKKDMNAYVVQLTKHLSEQTNKKKKRRRLKQPDHSWWIYTTIALVLLLCMLGFILYREWLHR